MRESQATQYARSTNQQTHCFTGGFFLVFNRLVKEGKMQTEERVGAASVIYDFEGSFFLGAAAVEPPLVACEVPLAAEMHI